MWIKLKSDFLGSAAGKVMDVGEQDARTLIEKGVAEVAGDEALAPVVGKATEALMNKLNDSVGAIVDATLKRLQEAQEQARRVAVPDRKSVV